MDVLENFRCFSPQNELCSSLHEKDKTKVKWEVNECPETFSDSSKVVVVYSVEIKHVDEILVKCQIRR